MSAFDSSVGNEVAVLYPVSPGHVPYVYEPYADTFMSGQPSYTEGGPWKAEGVRTGSSIVDEPDRSASLDIHHSQLGRTLQMLSQNPASFIGGASPSLYGYQSAEYARDPMLPDYSRWQAAHEQYSSVTPTHTTLVDLEDEALTRLSPCSTFMHGQPPPSAAFPSYVPLADPSIRPYEEGSFRTRPPQIVQSNASFFPFMDYNLSLPQIQDPYLGDSPVVRNAGYSAILQGTVNQNHRYNHVAPPADYATALALVDGRDMVGKESSLNNEGAHLAGIQQRQAEQDEQVAVSGFFESTLGVHEMFPNGDQYKGEFHPAFLDGSSQNTGLFPVSSLPATESMDSAIVDAPTREENLRSSAIKVLKDSRSRLWGASFKCRKCHELNWFDPDDQNCSAQVHRIYHSAAVDVVADNLENVLGWPQGTWNGATSSKMESFHIWMYINRDRNLSHKDLPGNAGVNREAHKRRLAKMWRARTRKRLAGSKISEGDSLSKFILKPTSEGTVSGTAPAHVRWSLAQIEAFRMRLIDWMRTAPQTELRGGHNCSSCPKKLWYHPGSCEDQSHSVYNSAAISVVEEYLESNGYGRVDVEDCHIWHYLTNKSRPLTKLAGIRRRYNAALRQRRYERRKALEAREASSERKGPFHSSQ